MGESNLGRSDVVRWYFWVTALISSPHVYSTYVRLQRKMKEGKVSYLVGFPTYFFIVSTMMLGTFLGFFVEVMTFVNVWQSFHYLRQTYGIGCFYSRGTIQDAQDYKL